MALKEKIILLLLNSQFPHFNLNLEINMFLGLDLGSFTCKAVLIDEEFKVKQTFVVLTKGDYQAALNTLLQMISAKNSKQFPQSSLFIGVTGAGRHLFDWPAEIEPVNEIIALVLGAHHLRPEAVSIVEIGATNSRWIQKTASPDPLSRPEIIEFALNDQCAAGSGAFLTQQAGRLKLSIEEFSSLAAQASKGASIAGRCSVFAKSDMIHLQQKGIPVDEIALGVCLGLVRNYLATLLKGKELIPPVIFCGGTAKNKGLMRAFKEILHLSSSELFVPSSPELVAALGAGLGAINKAQPLSLPELQKSLVTKKAEPKESPLALPPLNPLPRPPQDEPTLYLEKKIEAFLGVDVGSVSTNFALLDRDGNIITGVYLPTQGRPLHALREGWRLLQEKGNHKINIIGLGTTGSGRHLAGRLLHADVIRNEITAQLQGTLPFFPEVETIFEIGGQDSKYIAVDHGRIKDFTMNKICAAGTGSFLEEQAEPFGIKIKDEFAAIASKSSQPYDLGSRCTVFMESEMVRASSKGVPLPDLMAGLAYSIARNYLEKVVEGRPIGENIVFQGGVASNAAVVKAFSQLLNKEIKVHPYNRISGAIGAAFIAREAILKKEKAGEKREAINSLLEHRLGSDFQISTFECQHCSNHCQVTLMRIEKEKLFFGDVCERYTSQTKSSEEISAHANPNRAPYYLPLIRDELLQKIIAFKPGSRGRIGLPRASFFYEFLPFWASFFSYLDFEIRLSPPSSSQILSLGLKRLSAETCAPIKLAFGHTEIFRHQHVDWVFLPSIVDQHQEKGESIYLCPYSEHLPFMFPTKLNGRLLTPVVRLNWGWKEFKHSMSKVAAQLGLTTEEMAEAYHFAWEKQRDFQHLLSEKGRDFLTQARQSGADILVIIGRPYTIYDSFLNLNLHLHLERRGAWMVPLDFLPSEELPASLWPGQPPWRYAQKIIRTALWAAQEKKAFPIILTNFGCGLDAFIHKHLHYILKDKPTLFLEFDEHRGEAGLITRLEAFLDEIKEHQSSESSSTVTFLIPQPPTLVEESRERTFIIPYFSDHVYAFSGAFRSIGLRVKTLPPPDEKSIALGEEWTSGKECHAFSIIAGDLIKTARSAREGNEIFYFPGARYACLLQQYQDGLNYLLLDLGISDLKVLAPSSTFLWQLLGFQGVKRLWDGLLAVDWLVKAACVRRPYEKQKGLTDQIHQINLKDIELSLATDNLSSALKRCAERLKEIPINPEPRPKIGLAGDIYTRQNPVANHNLFLKLEEMGCEVWPSPFIVDDVDFGLQKEFFLNLRRRNFLRALGAGLLNLRKELEKYKIEKSLQGIIPDWKEPGFRQVEELISPYLSLDNNQTLILNIAKMVDFASRGADGVINAICFNCMLGTVSGAIAQKIRRDFKNIPIPALIFKGKEDLTEESRLEAFVYQVKQLWEKKQQQAARQIR